MLRQERRHWVLLIVTFFVFSGAVQTTDAWDMIPPQESVRNATEDFDQAWRSDANRKFSELRNIHSNDITSYILMLAIVFMIVVFLRLIVKFNHMERTSKRVRPDMLKVYTQMWLISRWGLRH